MSKLVYLNPNDRPNHQKTRRFNPYAPNEYQRFILWAGHAYGSNPTYFVYYGSFEDALDEVIDWLADTKNEHTGVLCNDEVEEAYKAYIAERNPEGISIAELDESLVSEAYEHATVDVTTGGNCGDHIMSDSWGIYAENPTRQQVKDLIADLQAKSYDNSSVVVIV